MLTININDLVGAAAVRTLDWYPIASLTDKDRAYGIIGGRMLFFEFDAASTEANDVALHPYKVRPDDYATAGVWIEVLPYLPTLADGYVWLGNGDDQPTAAVVLQNVVEDETPQLGGNLDMNLKNIVEAPGAVADLGSVGIIEQVTVTVNAEGFGAPLYLGSNSEYYTAEADDTAKCPAIALALETGTGTKWVLRKGYIRDDSWGWTVGGEAGLLYLSATLGTMTQTKPVATGDRQQVLGYAYSADIVYFSPQLYMPVAP